MQQALAVVAHSKALRNELKTYVPTFYLKTTEHLWVEHQGRMHQLGSGAWFCRAGQLYFPYGTMWLQRRFSGVEWHLWMYDPTSTDNAILGPAGFKALLKRLRALNPHSQENCAALDQFLLSAA